MTKNMLKGRAWAARVFEERLASGKLPRLGSGYTDEERAARAVRDIAERKLYVQSKRSSVRQDAPLSKWDREFWQGVQSWSIGRELRAREPATWEECEQAIIEWGELDHIDVEFLEHKKKTTLKSVSTELTLDILDSGYDPCEGE